MYQNKKEKDGQNYQNQKLLSDFIIVIMLNKQGKLGQL